MFELARYAQQKVEQNPKLELLAERQSISVCFRYANKDISDLNGFNVELREKLLKSGQGMINYAYVGDSVALRLVTLNPELSFDDIDSFFEGLIRTAQS